MAKRASQGRGITSPRTRGKHRAAPETDLLLTPEAETAYLRFYERADVARQQGDTSSQHCMTLNVINEVLEKLIARDPFNKEFALSGSLSDLYRVTRGSLRISWIASSVNGRVFVVSIVEMPTTGNATTPYEILTRLVLSGKADQLFQELELPSPRALPIRPFLKN
jgi:hypothetical protein